MSPPPYLDGFGASEPLCLSSLLDFKAKFGMPCSCSTKWLFFRSGQCESCSLPGQHGQADCTLPSAVSALFTQALLHALGPISLRLFLQDFFHGFRAVPFLGFLLKTLVLFLPSGPSSCDGSLAFLVETVLTCLYFSLHVLGICTIVHSPLVISPVECRLWEDGVASLSGNLEQCMATEGPQETLARQWWHFNPSTQEAEVGL